MNFTSMRAWFYGGAIGALILGLYLLWLWQPDRQVQRHTENLLRAMETKNWNRFAAFIADDYHDQWQNDRARLLDRTRAVFQFVRAARLSTIGPELVHDTGTVHWRSRVTVEGDAGEITGLIKERVNGLNPPFDLEWRQASWKPWDWRLVSVSNPELAIPEFEY